MELTYIDDDKLTIRNAISAWIKPLAKGRTPFLSTYSKKITVEHFNITGATESVTTYTVYPIDALPFKGDQEFSVDSNVLKLQIIDAV